MVKPSLYESNYCIGIEDGPFQSRKFSGHYKAPIVIVCMDESHLQWVRTGKVTVDGLDATNVVLRMLKQVKMRKDCPILLGGVTFAGFNIIDPHVLHQAFHVPVIVVIGVHPNNKSVKRALVRHFKDWPHRWRIIQSLGPLHRIRTVPSENPIYYEMFGCTTYEARKILKSWALVSRMPEPLRVASMVARGLFPIATS